MNDDQELDPALALTVAAVWRQSRISCPHPHLLQSYLQGGLQGGAKDFLQFHLRDSQCPYCNAVVEELRARDAAAASPVLDDLRDRLLRSTAVELRRGRA
jgi:hypothetical protein